MGEIYQIKIAELHPHPDNPYGIRNDPGMMGLVESVKQCGFSKHVSEEIHKMPHMMRHREYYAKIERRNQLAKALEAEVGCKNQYHLVSVACAWEQRSYSASKDGFYLGYHAAVAILEEVDPSSFPRLQMEGNILCMEHQLDFFRNRREK